jgi:hypothetical protein
MSSFYSCVIGCLRVFQICYASDARPVPYVIGVDVLFSFACSFPPVGHLSIMIVFIFVPS